MFKYLTINEILTHSQYRIIHIVNKMYQFIKEYPVES